jgi:hypothetical protein
MVLKSLLDSNATVQRQKRKNQEKCFGLLIQKGTDLSGVTDGQSRRHQLVIPHLNAQLGREWLETFGFK